MSNMPIVTPVLSASPRRPRHLLRRRRLHHRHRLDFRRLSGAPVLRRILALGRHSGVNILVVTSHAGVLRAPVFRRSRTGALRRSMERRGDLGRRRSGRAWDLSRRRSDRALDRVVPSVRRRSGSISRGHHLHRRRNDSASIRLELRSRREHTPRRSTAGL